MPAVCVPSRLVRFAVAVAAASLVASCTTTQSTIAPVQTAAKTPSVIDDGLKNIGIASPATLVRAVNELGESTAGYTQQGLELSYVAYKMIEVLYPLYLKPEYVVFPPVASIYPDLFKQVQAGTFPKVKQTDVSFLTTIIPPLAVLYSQKPDITEASIEALDHAEALNPSSVLPPYLKGLIAERAGDLPTAESDYDRALAVDSSCYPATIGKARVLIQQSQYADAAELLEALAPTIPPDSQTYRLDAQARYASGDYPDALQAVLHALALNPNGQQALILSAKIYQGQKNWSSALDQIGKVEKLRGPDSETSLLKASIQRDSGDPIAALQTLAAAVKRTPNDKTMSDAYGKALVDAGRTTEGSKYLSQSLAKDPQGFDSLELLLSDAIKSSNWTQASIYLPKVLELRTDEQTLAQAFAVAKALGDNKQMLSYAKQLETLDPSDGAYVIQYIGALLATNNPIAARSQIDSSLENESLPATRSELFYLRSLTDTSRAERVGDLRQALFENMENEEALFAITRIYATSGDVLLARQYANQAKALMPDGATLPNDIAKLTDAGG